MCAKLSPTLLEPEPRIGFSPSMWTENHSLSLKTSTFNTTKCLSPQARTLMSRHRIGNRKKIISFQTFKLVSNIVDRILTRPGRKLMLTFSSRKRDFVSTNRINIDKPRSYVSETRRHTYSNPIHWPFNVDGRGRAEKQRSQGNYFSNDRETYMMNRSGSWAAAMLLAIRKVFKMPR